jgi:hypothetical protein
MRRREFLGVLGSVAGGARALPAFLKGEKASDMPVQLPTGFEFGQDARHPNSGRIVRPR